MNRLNGIVETKGGQTELCLSRLQSFASVSFNSNCVEKFKLSNLVQLYQRNKLKHGERKVARPFAFNVIVNRVLKYRDTK
jgi:hypothetical protein